MGFQRSYETLALNLAEEFPEIVDRKNDKFISYILQNTPILAGDDNEKL
jgi:hypothetical protein